MIIVTHVVRANCGWNNARKLGRFKVPAAFFSAHAGDSGRNGRITISGSAAASGADAAKAEAGFGGGADWIGGTGGRCLVAARKAARSDTASSMTSRVPEPDAERIVAAAEVAVGLAIIVALFRMRRTVQVDELNALKH